MYNIYIRMKIRNEISKAIFKQKSSFCLPRKCNVRHVQRYTREIPIHSQRCIWNMENLHMEFVYRKSVQNYRPLLRYPKNVTFLANLSTFSFPCRSIHHDTVVSAFLFDIAHHRSSDGTKKEDSRGASFTFEAATAISIIRSRLFFPPIVLARDIEKQFSQFHGHIHRQVRDILVKSSQRNVEGKVISPKRRTCSFERNGG